MRCVSGCKYGSIALRWGSSWRAEYGLAEVDESETEMEGRRNREFGERGRKCSGTMKEKFEGTC